MSENTTQMFKIKELCPQPKFNFFCVRDGSIRIPNFNGGGALSLSLSLSTSSFPTWVAGSKIGIRNQICAEQKKERR